MKQASLLSRAVAALPLTLAMSCGLFGPGKPKDPLEKLEAAIQTYTTNTPTSIPTTITGNAGTSWSNRGVTFGFTNYSDKITKFEMKRVINGVETICDERDADGKPMVNRNLGDWAAASTQYTLIITADTFTKTFGPYDITVQSAERVVTGGVSMSDQANADAFTSSGPFFQSRTVDIGAGGYTGANFNTILAQYQPRLLDFAFLTVGTQLKAVSPHLIPTTHTFDRLVNDCGYQTTTFAAYTGPLDPQATPLTLAEVTALPDPPAAATSIAISSGFKFSYRTSDGKKGLIKVGTVSTTTPVSIGIDYSSAQ